MAYNKTDLTKAILQNLGMLNRPGDVTTSDSTVVGIRIDAGVATLAANDITTINTASIGDAFFVPLVAWLAQVCAPDFYKPIDGGIMDSAVKALRETDRAAQTAQTTVDGRLYTAILRKLGHLRPGDHP